MDDLGVLPFQETSISLLRISFVQSLYPFVSPQETGSLCQFDDSMGRAIFVSHQWLGIQHPDPSFKQLLVLQKALMDLISGVCRVSLPPVIELWFGRLRLPTAADFNAQGLFLWYLANFSVFTRFDVFRHLFQTACSQGKTFPFLWYSLVLPSSKV